MANLTIFGLVQLTSAGADLANDLVPVWDNDALETKKMTLSDLRNLMSPANWSDSFSSATQATSSWTPNNAAANVNAAIRPKGTGAITAAIPDGTTVGGNARGTYAVDLQMSRSAADRVAGGAYSFIGGGNNNGLGIAPYASIVGGNGNRINDVTGAQAGNSIIGGGSGNYIDRSHSSFIGSGDTNTIGRPNSAIVGGSTNTVSGFLCFLGGGLSNGIGNVDYATITGGRSNTASANYSYVGGGQSNTASNTHSAVVGGATNVASGNQSFVGGGNQNTAGYIADTICGGDQNKLTGANNSAYRFIGGGQRNTVNAEQSGATTICGGNGNTIYAGSSGGFIGGGGIAAFPGGNFLTGTNAAIVGGIANQIGNKSNFTGATAAFIGGGESNIISQNANHSSILGGSSNNINTNVTYATITGGYQGTAALYGQQVHASGRFAANGDAQAHELIWRRAITGTAQTELFLDGTSIAAILPGTNSVWNGIIDVTAICTVTGDGTTVVGHVEATSYKVTIKRIGTATSLVGTVQEIGTTNADVSMASSVFTIDNNDTNESLRVQFTPPSSAGSTTVIRAIATFRGQQIQY